MMPHIFTMATNLSATCLVIAVGVCAGGCGRNDTAPGPVATSVPLAEPEHAPPATETFADLNVAETLRKVSDRMYAIGETSGNLKEWDAAVAGAAKHIAERMKDSSKHEELLRPVDDKATPLIFASMNGYPQVVDELLRFESVRKTLEQPGPYDMTPWQLSNLAPQLTLLAINPTIRSSPQRLVAYWVKTPYYTHEGYAPYERVRASLAAAGAAQEPTRVRAVLVESPRCPDDVKERVKKANDVLAALRDIIVHDRVHGLPSLDPTGPTKR